MTEAALAKMNDWVAQYVKIAKAALRGKKHSLDASADRRDGAYDQDGGATGRSEEGRGDECGEEGVRMERPGRFRSSGKHSQMIDQIDHHGEPDHHLKPARSDSCPSPVTPAVERLGLEREPEGM